jgi:adenosylcobinamide-phosphate synthase
MTQILLTILLAILLDRFVPDRGGLNLLGWYQDWAESIEQRFNGGTRGQGVGAVLVAIVPIALGVLVTHYLLNEIGRPLGFLFDVLVLYVCLDLFRLGAIAGSISGSLDEGDLRAANEQLEGLVGRPVSEPTEPGVARGTVEAVLKQGNSLVMAPLFWFIVLGPVGPILQRLAAMLDKLWGHRNERFADFGWAAARFNDLMGWVPARITALSYAIMGSFEDALHCWRRKAGMWSDINSGPLLASGLGAMHMTNCEPSDIDEQIQTEPMLTAVLADSGHVRRVIALLWRVLLFWLVVALLMAGAHLFGIFFP